MTLAIASPNTPGQTPTTIGTAPGVDATPGSAMADFMALVASLGLAVAGGTKTDAAKADAPGKGEDLATRLLAQINGRVEGQAEGEADPAASDTDGDDAPIEDILASLLKALDQIPATELPQPVSQVAGTVPQPEPSGITNLLAMVTDYVTRSAPAAATPEKTDAAGAGISTQAVATIAHAPAPQATAAAPVIPATDGGQAEQQAAQPALAAFAVLLGQMEAETDGKTSPAMPAQAPVGDPAPATAQDGTMARLGAILERLTTQSAAATPQAHPALQLSPQARQAVAANTAHPAAPAERDSRPADAATPVQAAAATPFFMPAPAQPTQPADIEATGAAEVAPADHDLNIRHHLDLARDAEWLDTLARDISRAAARDGQLQFQLNPEHLGSLKIEVTNSANGTSIRMTADTEAARSILADAQPRLIAEARAQGLRINEAQVDLGGQGNARQQDAAPVVVIRTDDGSVVAEVEQNVSPGAGERYA